MLDVQQARCEMSKEKEAQSPEEALRRLKDQLDYLEKRGLMDAAETLRKRSKDSEDIDEKGILRDNRIK